MRTVKSTYPCEGAYEFRYNFLMRILWRSSVTSDPTVISRAKTIRIGPSHAHVLLVSATAAHAPGQNSINRTYFDEG